MRHLTLLRFWQHYQQLPKEVQEFDATGRDYSPMILTSTRLRRRPSNSP